VLLTADPDGKEEKMTLVVSPTQRTSYDVTASTLADVVKLLSEDEAGKCDWGAGFDYDGVGGDGKARNLIVTMEITIELPRWVGRDSAKGAEQREWDRFMRALEAHELGHERIAHSGAQTMYRRLQRTSARDLQDAFEEERAKIKRQDKAFDKRTDHGRKPLPGTVITVP
jgi:predicted secreted Zn-dependent protease